MHRHLEYPEGSLYDYLAETARQYPAYTALNYFGRKIRFSQLVKEIGRTAAALKAAGVQKGDSVSVCLPNIPEAIFLFYAVNKVGAVANMIHPMSAENEIIRFLTLTESKYLFAVDLIADKVRAVAKQVPLKAAVGVSVAEGMPLITKLGYRITQKQKPDLTGLMPWKAFLAKASACTGETNTHAASGDVAAILYSGGTTGKPKGIMLTNYNFNALAVHSVDACGGLAPGDKMLSVMPIFHGFGLGVCIHTILTLGGTAVIQPKFSVKNFHKLLFKYRPDIIKDTGIGCRIGTGRSADRILIDLHELVLRPGTSMSFRRELSTERLDFPAVLSYEAPPVGEGVIVNSAGALSLTGTIRADMRCRCDRCAREFDLRREINVETQLADQL